MIPFLIPLLAIGALAFLVTRRPQPQAQSIVPHQPLLASGAAPSGAPSPLVVLDQLVAAGQTPPPFVVACAIAEAESMGMTDVSNMLFQLFAIPMIAQARGAEVSQARNANPMPPMPPMPMPMPQHAMPPTQAWPSPPAVDPASFQGQAAPGSGANDRSQHHAHHAHHAHGHGGHGGHGGHVHGQAQAQAQDGWGMWPGWPMTPGPGAPIDAQGYDVAAAAPRQAGAPVAPGPSSRLPSIADPAYGTRVEIVDRSDRPDRYPGRPSGRHAGQGPNDGTITVSGMNSPIADISNHEWTSFAHRVSRELPTFSSPNHLGQYRQNKRRLARLGFDPAALQSSPELQGAAFAADMADAFRHMNSSGLIAEYCGATIEIPEAAGPVPIEITLSGIMGVAQAAGLEGAVGWLANPQDRQRFPGTTAAFLRTNGVF